MSLFINLSGRLTMAELRRAIFETLWEIEDEYALRYSRSVSLYMHPTDAFGDKVIVRNEADGIVKRTTMRMVAGSCHSLSTRSKKR